MFKFSLLRWISAKFRNYGCATRGGTVHSITMEVYDNGRRVIDREIDAYETNGDNADDFYIARRMHAYTSEVYGRMRKEIKERARLAKRNERHISKEGPNYVS